MNLRQKFSVLVIGSRLMEIREWVMFGIKSHVLIFRRNLHEKKEFWTGTMIRITIFRYGEELIILL